MAHPVSTRPEYVKALTYYVDKLVPNAPAGSLTGSYDFVVSQLNSGLIAMTGPFYLDQWANAVKTERLIDGSEICAAPNPSGGRVWAGAFNIGIPKASKHPDEAWAFLKYITGKDAQRLICQGWRQRHPRQHHDGQGILYRQPCHRRSLPGGLPDQYLGGYMLAHQHDLVPQVGKIYEEAPAWLSAAVTKQQTPQEAMDGYAAAITKLCGGKACEVVLEGVTKPDPAADCSFEFDRSLQVRKLN